MRAFRCKECGTGYSTTGDDVPPSPNWDDGHVCIMTEVESKMASFEENERRMDLIGRNGNDGLHYDKEGFDEFKK